MRREIILPFFLAFLASLTIYSLCSAGLVFAQTGETVQDRLENVRENRLEILGRQKQKRENIRENVQETRQDIREKVATKQAELRAKVVERIKNVFSKILRRLNAALVRLDKIAQRVATRIDKLKARGVDTSAAEAALLNAEGKGSAAAVSIENAQVQIEVIDPTSSTVRDAVHAARAAVGGAKDALKAYHKALVLAIRELKSAHDLREGTESAE
ncbi:hypothetical protein A3A49_01625 [Candidatus Curtissbacteria bacterium RIFCSPLOWO2_01_FULL_38_11b]|uniref:DUF5667 domain-containing protein n=1 Tax=Candidatus Curtissbacteria bacterium RIFCSPLOWO2_01_FULL_38_11b TaxID=1797725 RepID=A0A1F5H1Y3_9BACT|nr:MAG: hypothetical protein A3A49_01625 [Candidatus Curtissbacteria bacterium RIFCSPLOWO2_01_FULL_38_11b]